MKYIIPRFERTRAVQLVQMSDGTRVLVCSCRLWKTRGYACRHIYRVLRRNPKLSDANVRWQNGYRQNYGRHDELTEAFMNDELVAIFHEVKNRPDLKSNHQIDFEELSTQERIQIILEIL